MQLENSSPSPSDALPARVGPYTVIRALAGSRTCLAKDSSGRLVVAKELDADVLLRGKLHPNVRDRLQRVREIAHMGVANLMGVERGDARAFEVWQFIEGKTLEEQCPSVGTRAEFARLGREVVLTVESLHLLGIVHGRLHARNVLVDLSGKIRLTHVSPLLYDDFETDLHDLSTMLENILRTRGWAEDAELKGLSACRSLPDLRLVLDQLAHPSQHVSDEAKAEMVGPRRKILWGAGAITLVAILFVAVILHLSQQATTSRTFVAPEAPRAALQPSTE